MAEPIGNAQGGLLDIVGGLHDCIGADVPFTALDLMNAGIVLTDAACRIVHANKVAEQLMDGGALLCIEDMLSARHARSAVELRDAITGTAEGAAVRIPKAGMAVIARGIGGPDLAVWVLPLDGRLRRQLGASLEASIAVLIRKPGDMSPFPPNSSAAPAR